MLAAVVAGGTEKIYSECVSASNSKRFFAASNTAMWSRMSGASTRCFSEVIANRPCHLYLDFDEGDVYASWRRLEPFLNKLLNTLNLNYKHVLLDASQGNKQSLHVVTVCNCWLLETPVHGRYLLHMLQDLYNINLETLDMSIYSRNRCFRMLGSSKYGQNRPFKGTWTQENWEQTLVQPLHDLKQVEILALRVPREVFKAYAREPPCVTKLMQFFKAKDYRWRSPGCWRFCGHLENKMCAIHKRVHRRNNIFFNFELGFTKIRLKCMKNGGCWHEDVPLDIQSEITVFLNTLI